MHYFAYLQTGFHTWKLQKDRLILHMSAYKRMQVLYYQYSSYNMHKK